MGYAFISYSTKNQPDADALKQIFVKKGIRTWMAPGDIPVGSKYAQVINRAIKECDCFVLLLTDAAQNSPWVAKEVERAVNYGKTILPIKLENLVLNEEFEFYISTDQIVAVQKIDEDTDAINKILAGVMALTGCEEELKEPKRSAESKQASRPKQSEQQVERFESETAEKKAEDESKGLPQRSVISRLMSDEILLFHQFYIAEFVMYCLGLILFIFYAIADPEFALPLLLICFGLGFIPSLIKRLILKKATFFSSFNTFKAISLSALAYNVFITYHWGDNQYFFELFKDWGEYNTELCKPISTTLFLAFFAIGIAVGFILYFANKKNSRNVFSWLASVCAYATLAFAYSYLYEHVLVRTHLSDLYEDGQARAFGVAAVIFLCLFSLLFLVSKKEFFTKRSVPTK